MELENETDMGPNMDDLNHAETVFLEGKVELCEQVAERHNQLHSDLTNIVRGLVERVAEVERQLTTMATIAHVHQGQGAAPSFTLPPKGTAN
jgi:hypothetical protein